MTKKNDRDPLFVSSLAKGLKVLQCFSQKKPRLGVSEIARITEMPQATVWRLCHTLSKLGFLSQSEVDQTLTPNLPVITLGSALISGLPLIDVAYPSMVEIASRYNGAISIASRIGFEMIYLQRYTGSAVVYGDLRAGSRVPIATSAPGWAYLAGLNTEARATMLKALQMEYQQEWPTIKDKLTKSLDRYEKDGYVICNGILHPKINAVAVPLHAEDAGQSDEFNVVIACGGLKDYFNRKTQEKLGCELLELAHKLQLAGKVK